MRSNAPRLALKAVSGASTEAGRGDERTAAALLLSSSLFSSSSRVCAFSMAESGSKVTFSVGQGAWRSVMMMMIS